MTVPSEDSRAIPEHRVSQRVRKLDAAIEWAAYREFALVHGDWDGTDGESRTR